MSRREVFQDQPRLKRLFRYRLLAIIAIVVVLCLLLIGRLFYLQVLQHPYYKTLSHNNSISLVPAPPTRGLIYDRNGVVLAENLPAYSLEITPDRVIDLSATIAALSKIIPITAEDKQLFYKELKRKHSFDQVPIKMKLTPLQVAKFSVNQYRFPGVNVVAGLIRHYPFANDLVSVLGYVGRINERDLKNVDESNYAATNYIGKVGVEKYFETILHGTVGYRQIEIDASGREVRTLSHTPAVAGNDIYLTIDSGLQEAALSAMAGDRGALVAIQPSSGQVLAMVSTPAYDPNLFVRGISNKDYEALHDSKKQPLFNRAIRGQFPFASTIKVFLALELLDGNFTTASHQIFDPGFFRINDHSRIFHDEKKHGWVNLEKAIEVSCDTYFYIMSLKMGIVPIDKILTQFGFGQYTHIQMHEELPGLVATPAWKMKTHKQKWYPGDTLNSSIGQGSMLTTPLQLASATATLSEKGTRYQPTLLLRQVTPNGQVINAPSVKVGTIKLKASAWQHVINGMIKVVKGKQGTAWRFGRHAPYSVAAKTGTAQVYSLRGQKYVLANVPLHLRDNSMFIAFAPVNNPKIAIAVAIQNQPNAPVVARKVLDYYLLKQQHLSRSDKEKLPTHIQHSTYKFEKMALGDFNAE
jgi:penicillin-binding protein 2